MSAPPWPSPEKPSVTVGLPPPDSPGGYAICTASFFALVYALLLVADYDQMVALAPWVVTVSLLVGVVGTFSLAGMIGADVATFQRLDLDLARTIVAHRAENDAPSPEAPLAGVWRAYVTVADESRRVARTHAYAFGPFLTGTVVSLGAALITGLGVVGPTTNVIGIGLVVEFFGFGLLLLGAGALVLSVGYSGTVDGYHRWAARRWRRNSARLPAVEEALESVPWLPEFHRGVRESQTDPTSSTIRWIAP